MDLGSLLAPRTVEDCLAERIVLSLGGVRYVLPVLPIRASRDWEESLDGELVWLLRTIEDEDDEVGAVFAALAESPRRFVDLLLAYDQADVLPDRETIEATNTEMSVLCAVLEVWRAAHPLADIGIELFAMEGRRLSSLPELTSTLWPNGDTTTEGSRVH